MNTMLHDVNAFFESLPCLILICNSTDIGVKLVPLKPGVTLPSEWKLLQALSLGNRGKVNFSKTIKDIPVTDNQFLFSTDKLNLHDKVQIMLVLTECGQDDTPGPRCQRQTGRCELVKQ